MKKNLLIIAMALMALPALAEVVPVEITITTKVDRVEASVANIDFDNGIYEIPVWVYAVGADNPERKIGSATRTQIETLYGTTNIMALTVQQFYDGIKMFVLQDISGVE